MIHPFCCREPEAALLVSVAFLPWRVTAISVGTSEGVKEPPHKACVYPEPKHGSLARAELKLGTHSEVDRDPVAGSFGPVKPLNSGFCGQRLQLPRSTQHLGLT